MQETPAAPAPAQAAVRIEAGPATAAQTIQIPQSAQDIAGLRARRSELADQLEQTMDRREEITDEWEQTPLADRASLDQVVTAIDGRIVQLEADIAATERALTSARPELLAVAAQREEAARADLEAVRNGNREERMAVLFAFFLVFMLGLTFVRRFWSRQPPPRPMAVESAGRLERIEQAVEAMAIEIERVSEGQRFVTKLLSEAKAAPAPDHARMQPTIHTGRES
jgi:hypothetical protein